MLLSLIMLKLVKVVPPVTVYRQFLKTAVSLMMNARQMTWRQRHPNGLLMESLPAYSITLISKWHAITQSI